VLHGVPTALGVWSNDSPIPPPNASVGSLPPEPVLLQVFSVSDLSLIAAFFHWTSRGDFFASPRCRRMSCSSPPPSVSSSVPPLPVTADPPLLLFCRRRGFGFDSTDSTALSRSFFSTAGFDTFLSSPSFFSVYLAGFFPYKMVCLPARPVLFFSIVPFFHSASFNGNFRFSVKPFRLSIRRGSVFLTSLCGSLSALAALDVFFPLSLLSVNVPRGGSGRFIRCEIFLLPPIRRPLPSGPLITFPPLVDPLYRGLAWGHEFPTRLAFWPVFLLNVIFRVQSPFSLESHLLRSRVRFFRRVQSSFFHDFIS